MAAAEARGRILGARGSAAAASLSCARGRARRLGEASAMVLVRRNCDGAWAHYGGARSCGGVGVGSLARARADAVLGTAELVIKGSPVKQNRK